MKPRSSTTKHRIKGTARQVKGGIKKAAGKLTGNRRMQAEGKLESHVGTAQRRVGRAADRAASRIPAKARRMSNARSRSRASRRTSGKR